jgi:hypothetical protein
MKRLTPGLAILLAAASAVAIGAQQPARGRPLAIEDYYRLQAVGSPAILPSGRRVALTVSTRIEDDSSTRTETFAVPVDASARPLRVLRKRHCRRVVDGGQPPRVRGRAGG